MGPHHCFIPSFHHFNVPSWDWRIALCQEREKMGLDPVWWSSALWALGGSVVYRDQYFSLPLVTCDPSSIQLLSNYIFRLKGVSERNRVVTLPTVLLLLSLPVTTFVSWRWCSPSSHGDLPSRWSFFSFFGWGRHPPFILDIYLLKMYFLSTVALLHFFMVKN